MRITTRWIAAGWWESNVPSCLGLPGGSDKNGEPRTSPAKDVAGPAALADPAIDQARYLVRRSGDRPTFTLPFLMGLHVSSTSQACFTLNWEGTL